MSTYSISDKCVGCTLCAKSCPTGAIKGEPRQRHEIDPDYCVCCGLCGRLCQKGAVLDPVGAQLSPLPRAQWPRPVIDGDACAACRVCVENCPADCLALSEPAFHGDIRIIARLARPEDCIGCGICESSCPIAAVSMGPVPASP